MKQAILVVSFGTSYPDTRACTIEAIEADIRQAYPDNTVYRAWTSKMIIKKLRTRDGIHVDTVDQAMARMVKDGVQTLLVQPTHILNGIENDCMKAEILAYQADFKSIAFGNPLFTSTEDLQAMVDILAEEFSDVKDDTAVLLMGHGSDHDANMAYAALDYHCKARGQAQLFIGTVEGYPALDDLLQALQTTDYRNVLLAPLMIVAGDHATNDLVGKSAESWYNRCKQAGFTVSYRLKGLGEYEKVRALLLDHLHTAAQKGF